MELSALAFCAFFASALAGNHDKYNGYSVFNVHLRNELDQKLLGSLEAELDVDIWSHGAIGLRDAVVMVSPEKKSQFIENLSQQNVTQSLHLDDVAKSLEQSDLELARWRQSRSNKMVPFLNYPRYDEVNEYLERITREYPDLVTLVNVGPSFEGKHIKYLKISSSNFTDTSKPIYFLDAAMHAREWVTVPVALYVIHRLVEDLKEKDKDLIENVDWIILPIVNPDGYEYSHTNERLWRRSRSFYPDVSTSCYGVDINRNFDIQFNTTGVSSNPCSQTYTGTHAFSEPETRYVRDIILEYIDRMEIYQNIHSHGNYLLFGFGDGTLPPNAAHLHVVAAAMGAAIDAKKLEKASYYLIGNSNLVLYGTSGTAQDYGQAVGVKLSYTLELPGYEYNFLVPPQYINQINEETWEGIAVSARIASIQYQARNNKK